MAVTRVISAGSSFGATELRVTAYAFCRTRTPKAAGNSVMGLCRAADIPQHSRPRASRVPARMNLRPCWTRSSIGPMNGASTANGAMVTSRYKATWLRAWSRDVLKNRVPASATVTNASPALPAAVSSMRLARPVRPAPEARVIRWIRRPVPRPVAAPARALDRAAEPKVRFTRLARSLAPDSPMPPVFCVKGQATT